MPKKKIIVAGDFRLTNMLGVLGDKTRSELRFLPADVEEMQIGADKYPIRSYVQCVLIVPVSVSDKMRLHECYSVELHTIVPAAHVPAEVIPLKREES